MPKKKKQPKNAYYFFILEKKKEYERDGTRFHGIQDLFAMENLREEWKVLDVTARAKYDHLAKEAKAADSLDLTNKFTNTGESYAQVQERNNQAVMEGNLLEEILAIATAEGPGLNSRYFVIFKAIYMAEVGNPPNMEYWPAELAIASFNLDTGHASNWWTLVDVVETPMGYASAAKDTYDATLLPLPGSHKYKQRHRDYFNTLRNLKNFIQRYVDPINGYYILFVKPDNDRQPVDMGVLKWLHKHAQYETPDVAAEYEDFIFSIKLVKVAQLLLKLAGVARKRTPSYKPPVAVFDYLEQAALHVLASGDWDYKANITCAFHNLEEESMKTHLCCRNIVLRNLFLILREVIRPMQIPFVSTHYMTSIKTPDAYEVPPPTVNPEPKRETGYQRSAALDNDWGSEPLDGDNIADMFREARQPSSRFQTPPAPTPATQRGGSTSAYLTRAWGASQSDPSSFTHDDFPDLGSAQAGSGTGRGRGGGGLVARNSAGPSGPGGWAFPDAIPKPEFVEETHADLRQPSGLNWGNTGDSDANPWMKDDSSNRRGGQGRGRGGNRY